MNRKALGRGLGALLSSDSTIDLGAEPSEVEIDSIVPGPMQPRTHFDEASLESLADSIRAHGIVQPLLVRRRDGGYELIAGSDAGARRSWPESHACPVSSKKCRMTTCSRSR
jgi:ParB family chromosome partitioning protein